jgi:hypothetical protein
MNGVLENGLMDSLVSLQRQTTNISPDYRSEHIVMSGCSGCSNPCSGACSRNCSDVCAATMGR